jgi:hypothetical protein
MDEASQRRQVREMRVSKVGDKVIFEPSPAEKPSFDSKAFWANIDALGGEDLFRDGPPEDPPTEPDPRKYDLPRPPTVAPYRKDRRPS